MVRCLCREGVANRLAEALGIVRAFGKDEVSVDQQRLVDVCGAAAFQFLDRLGKEVDGGLASRKQFGFCKHDGCKANGGHHWCTSDAGRAKWPKLRELRTHRTSERYHMNVTLEAAMSRSRYVDVNHEGDWQVRNVQRRVASSFPSKAQALCAAIELAEKDGEGGQSPEVLVRHEDDRFITEWVYGEDVHPDDAARSAGRKQPGRSGA